MSFNFTGYEHAYESVESFSGAVTGSPQLVPGNVEGVAVTLQITSGTAKVQSTTDSVDAVNAGSAVWVDWPAGAVAVTTQDFVRAVSALRAVCVSGACRLMMRAQ